MQLTPVASATPDGRFRVVRSLRWIPAHELARIDRAERDFREAQAELPTDEAEFRWQNQVSRLMNASEAGLEEGELLIGKIGSRQAVLRELGGKDVIRRYAYSIGDAVRGERSRSHELKKSRVRRSRRR